MRITRGQLRRIIREEVISSSNIKTVSEADKSDQSKNLEAAKMEYKDDALREPRGTLNKSYNYIYELGILYNRILDTGIESELDSRDPTPLEKTVLVQREKFLEEITSYKNELEALMNMINKMIDEIR